MMSARAREVLCQLDALDREAGTNPDVDAEIVRDAGQVWFGSERISFSTLYRLLHCTAISLSSEGEPLERYVINSTGRAIVRRPALSYEVETAILRGRSFSIIDDTVVELGDPVQRDADPSGELAHSGKLCNEHKDLRPTREGGE